MNAIVTGSRVYGEPTDKSDIDLVILVSEDDMMNLVGVASMQERQRDSKEPTPDYGIGAMATSLRFGMLNLIVTTDPLQFEVWRRGTKVIKDYRDDHGPVSRARAKLLLSALRLHCGVMTIEPTMDSVEADKEEAEGNDYR